MQAFAWFSDLLVEHAEIFWSLFAVDMDHVLELQPPDTWDSFPLFQMLNDYLRTEGMSPGNGRGGGKCPGFEINMAQVSCLICVTLRDSW